MRPLEWDNDAEEHTLVVGGKSFPKHTELIYLLVK